MEQLNPQTLENLTPLVAVCVVFAACLCVLMRAFLSRVYSGDDVRLDPALVSAPLAELQQRLADLRSAQAAAD